MKKSYSYYENILKAGLIGMLAVVIKLLPLAKTFGLTSTTGEEGMMPAFYFIPMMIIYGLIALTFVEIKKNIKLGKKGAFTLVFSFFFVVDTLMSRIEGNFFIENYNLVLNMGIGFIEPLLITIAIFYLWKQDNVKTNIKEDVLTYFRSRSIISWIWRIFVILIVSFIAYMVLGALAFPITGPHMEELIKIPSMMENFTIQLLRGIAYLVVTIPMIIFWNNSDKKLFYHLALINILLYPVLGYAFSYFFPIIFRLADGTVLTIHVTFMSWLQVKLLSKKRNV